MCASQNSMRRRFGFQPVLENLEDRCVPATIPVVQYLGASSVLVGMLHPVDKGETVPINWAVPADPVLENNVDLLPAVRNWSKVGPQPEPPTKPLPGQVSILVGMLDQAKITPVPEPPNVAGQLDSGSAKILVGMLKPAPKGALAEIDPQPEPPRAAPVAINAIAAYFSQK